MDWRTLVFFAGMFVLMQAVWESGIFQTLLAQNGIPVTPFAVIAAGILGSQLVSNVPFVALFLPLLGGIGAPPASYLALAAGSTLAGNLLILGAASNVIVIQAAEKRGQTIGFLEFAKPGIVLTALQTAVLLGWFALVG
jgi:Na+/H+ antiporter NhaD/arsenite permease-like protein